MSKIYILLTYSGSLLSKFINIYTREPYSHVSVSLDKNLNELYSFGRLRPKNPLFAGFVKEDVENGTYSRFPKTRCALYSLEITEEQFKKVTEEIERFKNNRERYGYNLIGLLGVILNKPIERENNYFCSQFVSTVLKSGGIKLIDKPSGLIEPKDFRYCKELTLIYEGPLKTYSRQEELIFN